jgi:hypothetical protein
MQAAAARLGSYRPLGDIDYLLLSELNIHRSSQAAVEIPSIRDVFTAPKEYTCTGPLQY